MVGAVLALVFLSYLFRLPPLLNARSTNSDAAVVGLQAIHILRGEHSAFLWGSGYQTAADAYVAAGFFRLLGPTPLVLMLSALSLHVLATGLVFFTLVRRFPIGTALLLTTPLVFAPSSVHTYALYPPRQLSITLAIAALWALHGGSRRAGWRAQAWLASAGLFYGLAISADPYPMVLAPVVLGYGVLVSLERLRGRLIALASGVLAGLGPFVLLHQSARAKSGPMGLSLSVIGHNWNLLVKECLPWALSYKVYFARKVMDYAPWDAPVAIRVLGIVGAILVGLLVTFGLVAVGWKKIPRSTRLLGFAGALTFPVAIGAFLVSVMVMDHFSMRYLAVLTLLLPFAAASAAHVLERDRLAVVLAPHVLASAIAGWVGYGPFVRGGIYPVSETPELKDDYALRDLLRSRGIHWAEADYWASYRLTLLHREEIIVVPTNPSEDRYPPYRAAFSRAATFAYVFDPGRSRESLEDAERKLRAENAAVEKTQAGGHTVLLVTRSPSGSREAQSPPPTP